ncbi:MAG TPA: hypothetical protein VIL30_25725 [Ramlibacter sp.]|jgi:hypothetical protein
MPLTPSQLQAKLRELARREQQAIDRYNQQVRAQQRAQQQAVDKYNRDARAHNQRVQNDIAAYNRQVDRYNARVRADQQRVTNTLRALSRQPVSTRYTVLYESVQTVNASHSILERDIGQTTDQRYFEALDLSERENANSLELMGNLLENEHPNGTPAVVQADPKLVEELNSISPDLTSRWQGAIYALNPSNPDAARHFCTSSREIITGILELRAPDDQVLQFRPESDVTDQGKPTRREKIRYFLGKKGTPSESLGDFIEQDSSNVVELFQVFNSATHGVAGKFSFDQLVAIRRRVEDAIYFLARVSA